jgi:uncharacterized protein (TIGR02757 family)
MNIPDIRAVLDSLYENKSSAQLANDPLSFCHRFSDPADQEVAGLIASCFAYGNVNIILKTLEKIFEKIGSSPRRYVEQFDVQEGMSVFKGFKHRFNDCRDLCALLLAIRLMIEEAGSINAYFLKGHDPHADDVTASLDNFTNSVRSLDFSPVYGQKSIPDNAYFAFFFPAPRSGSACKRLCMYLRWVVRPQDGVDLGIWKGVRPAQLVIPVDTHIQRICRYLGFTSRRSADWRMACEVTSALRRLDANDPVKYDFAIAHLGISEGCDGKDPSICKACHISGICPQNSSSKL